MQQASTDQNAECASVGFDSRNRVITICIGVQGPALAGAGLYMFDPHTLDTLAHMDLPPRQPGVGTNPFTDFSSGGYFYLDNHDRAVIPTTTRHIWVVGETGGARNPGFALQRDYDLTGAVQPGDEIVSALPDWSGRIWFASRNGIVGTVTPGSGAVPLHRRT
jgi:ligand-binding sensor domain-containing protein